MNLVLGTVQFGLPYGLGGSGAPVPDSDVRSILSAAAELGISALDTASAYGDIETRLADLCSEGTWRITTKLPPLPRGLTAATVEAWANTCLERARGRLGPLLDSVMFHGTDGLLEPLADPLWKVCSDWAKAHHCKLGVSAYDTVTVNRIARRFPIAIAQLPGNALDQRLRTDPIDDAGIEVYLRSIFLQGLLLIPEAEAIQRIPNAKPALARWHAWLKQRGLDPLTAALGIAKGFPHVAHCVIGVDSVAHLRSIVAAWHVAPAIVDKDLETADLQVIDPRRWAGASGG